MHGYSRESRHTKLIHFFLGTFSALIAYFINGWLVSFDWRIVGSISFFTIFSITEFIFDRYALRLFAALPFSRTVDFSGKWKGHLCIASNPEEYPAEITIRQTWSKITIQFESDDARGKSFAASIFYDRLGDQRTELVYTYYAQSKSTKPKNHFDHYGTAFLGFDEKKYVLDGEYFTEKSRKSFGTITLNEKT